MKKVSVSAIIIFLCLSVTAQYKKASFFGKEGRTYGIGTQLYAMGDGKGSPVGFSLTFGRDQDGKQFFSSWELQYVPSYKFSFNTTDVDENPVTVNGKSKGHLIYAVNYGFYLLKNDVEDRKIKPFVTAGFNFVIKGGAKWSDNDYFETRKIVSTQTFSGGFKGGLGFNYNFSSQFSLKLDGGYNYQYNLAIDDLYDDRASSYFLFTSHPYVSAGVRYRLVRD